MVKFKTLVLLAFSVALLSSCTVVHSLSVTNNPVGSKVGIAKGTNFSPDLDITYATAAKNGKITKIGTAETKVVSILFFMKYTTIVTGE